MGAYKKNKLYIKVTKGDCLEKNRTSGNSNSGTYFISQEKNFPLFEQFFNFKKSYYFSYIHIRLYGILFNSCFEHLKSEYIGKMEEFNTNLDILLKNETDILTQVLIRECKKGDTRKFFRFNNNTNIYVNAFRNLLYENLSVIVIEDIGDCFLIYPEIIDSKLKRKTDNLFFEASED